MTRIIKYKFVLILVAIIFITVCVLIIINVQFNSQYKWSNKLVWAIEKQDISEVENLLKSEDMDINAPGGVKFPAYLFPENSRSLPLEAACYTGNYAIVELLLSKEANPNLPELDYGTPLLATLTEYNKNDYQIVKTLLEHGAKADKIAGCEGIPLASIASLTPETETDANEIVKIYKLLVQYCGEKSPVDESGYTILTNATIAQNTELINYMLHNQVFLINEKDEYGRTSLFYVGYVELEGEKDVEIAKLLLSYGADKTIIDDEGKTAYDYALDNGKYELAKQLK